MLSLSIAVRFLTSGKLQTILIILGIAIAISIQVFVGLLIGSLQQSLVDQTIGNSPQVTIYPSDEASTIRDWKAIVTQIDDLNITKAVTVSASANAFVRSDEKDLPIIFRGFIYDSADRIYGFNDSIISGRAFRSNREVLVGKELRDELDIRIGDKIVINLPGNKTVPYVIAGFYDLGTASINKTWIVANLQTAQQLFDFGNRVTSIEISVDDIFSADVTAGTIEGEINSQDITVENWKEQNADLLSALSSQQTSSTIIQAVIILSVVIAIASVLAISVLQKSRQIGILKAMGIKDGAASMVFLYQGFFLGLVGSAIGIALGLGLLFAFSYFTTNPDGSSLITLYIEEDFIIRSWIISIVAATIAGLVPARRSLRLNPIDVIREG